MCALRYTYMWSSIRVYVLSQKKMLGRRLIRRLSGSSRSISRFKKWLEDGNVMYDRLDIVENESSKQRVVRASDDIDEDEIVLRLPSERLITPEMGMNCRLGQIAKDMGLDELDGNMYLMMYLLEARQDAESEFFPYVSALPTPENSTHFPAFWDEMERQELLQGSSLLEDIDQQIELNRADYINLLSSEHKDYVSRIIPSTQEFMWAELMVSSRAFMVTMSERTSEHTHVMVPFADMLNTALPHTCDVSFGMENNHFVMRSLHHIPRGAEVRDSYGYKSTRRFLQHYGFAFFDNLDHTGVSPNVTRLKIPLRAPSSLTEEEEEEEEGKLFARKSVVARDILKKDTDKEFYLDIGSAHVQSGAVPDVVLSRLRLCVANESETRFIERNFSSNPNQVSFVGRRNEIAATSFLVQLLEKRLSEYPTTLEVDREMLISDPSVLSEHSTNSNNTDGESVMTINQRNALIHVAAEKVILTDWLRVAALQCATANSRAPASQSDLTSFYAKQTFLGSPPSASGVDSLSSTSVGRRRKRGSSSKKRRKKKKKK